MPRIWELIVAIHWSRKDLSIVLLLLNSSALQIVFLKEGAEINNLFPHIYGALNIDAVTGLIDLESHPDGSFLLPPEFVN
jgi:uncharacterized protein (DUF952 family)